MGISELVFNFFNYWFRLPVKEGRVVKRSNWQIWLISVGGRLAFYVSLLHILVKDKTSSRNWFDRIDSKVILGALPFRGMVKDLQELENVTGVVSLNQDYELWLFSHNKEVLK